MSFLTGPAAAVRRTGTPSEYDQLREILRRKLIKVPPALYPNLTLDDILGATGDLHFYPYHEHPLGNQICTGAAFTGILFYRGEVRENIKYQVTIDEWRFETLLSYFCSNCNRECSFSSYFKQTRARLYLAVQAKVYGTPTKVQELYMLACAEENGHTRVKQRGFKPTHYRERFIHEIQKDPEGFEVCSQTRTNGILKDMHRTLNSWKAIQHTFNPNNERHQKLSTLDKDLSEFFEKTNLTNGVKPASIAGVDPTANIRLNITKYEAFMYSHRMLHGLLTPMQGVYTVAPLILVEEDDLVDSLDGLKVAKDIGLDITPVHYDDNGPPPAIDPATMSEDRLALLGDTLIFDF